MSGKMYVLGRGFYWERLLRLRKKESQIQQVIEIGSRNQSNDRGQLQKSGSPQGGKKNHRELKKGVVFGAQKKI